MDNSFPEKLLLAVSVCSSSLFLKKLAAKPNLPVLFVTGLFYYQPI